MHSMPQRALAELFGTAALVLVGPGSVVATLTLAGKAVPVYWAAQYVGAIIGAFAIWGVFGHNAVGFGMGQTKFIDQSTSYYMQAALAEALGTGLLIFAILGIVDSKSPT